jgi:hypothetical protein
MSRRWVWRAQWFGPYRRLRWCRAAADMRFAILERRQQLRIAARARSGLVRFGCCGGVLGPWHGGRCRREWLA